MTQHALLPSRTRSYCWQHMLQIPHSISHWLYQNHRLAKSKLQTILAQRNHNWYCTSHRLNRASLRTRLKSSMGLWMYRDSSSLCNNTTLHWLVWHYPRNSLTIQSIWGQIGIISGSALASLWHLSALSLKSLLANFEMGGLGGDREAKPIL